MKTLLSRIALFAFISGLFFVACDGIEVEQDPLLDQQTAIDNTLSEDAVSDVFGIINDNTLSEDAVSDVFAMYSDNSDRNELKETSCAQTTWDAGSRLYTINFPDPGCTVRGALRTGTINVQFSGTNPQGKDYGPGITLTATFSNYTINGKTFEGTIAIEFESFSASTGAVFNVTTTNAKITNADGSTLEWNSEKNILWSSGFLTRNDATDNEFYIDGTTTGVTSNEVEYTMEITETMHLSGSCDYPMSGIMKLTQGDSWSQIDFGEDDCSPNAIYSAEGFSITIDLSSAMGGK